MRIMNDYGHIDDETNAVFIKKIGYKKTSLAVQKANYALKMFLNVGFEIVDENKEEYIMVNYLEKVAP